MIGTQFPPAGNTEKMKNHRTDLTTAATGKEEDGYFGKLPDDVIFNIFGRVNNCKFLTQCLLVNKHIASLIRLISCVIVNLPPPEAKHYLTERCSIILYNFDYFQDMLISPDDDDNDDDEEIARCWCPFNIDKLPSFYMCKAEEELHPFSKIKNAIVEYPKFVDDEISSDTKMRWIVEYSGGGSTGIIKSCAFLGQIDHLMGTDTLETSLKTSILTWVASSLRYASTLHPMVARMTHDHKSLRDILVTTTSRKGWIHAGENEIVKLRQAGGGVNAMRMMMKTMEKEMRMKVNAWYSVNVPNPPGESTVYAFVVVSNLKIIDREVNSATKRFWEECSYWAGHYDEVIQEGIDIRELVETMPPHFEGVVRKGKPLKS